MELSSITDVICKVSINLLGFLMPQQYRQFYLIIILWLHDLSAGYVWPVVRFVQTVSGFEAFIFFPPRISGFTKPHAPRHMVFDRDTEKAFTAPPCSRHSWQMTSSAWPPNRFENSVWKMAAVLIWREIYSKMSYKVLGVLRRQCICYVSWLQMTKKLKSAKVEIEFIDFYT